MTKKHYMALDDIQALWTDKIKPSLPTKAAVEELQQQVAERYQVTVTGHTCVFGNNAIVTGHKLVLT